jgi:rod shape determining protein RodA
MAIGVILLILVYFFGSYGGGAKRWLDIGIIRFQPSEIMKVIVPIAIASILSEKNIPPRLGLVLLSLLAIFFIGFLIYKQPDLGTAILIVSSGIYVLFFAGVRIQIIKNVWINLSVIFSSILGTLYLAWNYFLLPYQKQRILTMIDPESDPLGSGYHIIQSKIAIGSGGLTGKGYGAGSQSQLDFLPEHSTDFIFSVLAEEMGFVGVIFLLFLYGLIIYRSFQISIKSEDNFSKLLGLSLTLVFFTYVAINIAMVAGLVPVVGVPLPLVSYGGSSLLTILAIFGIIMSVNKHKLPGYLKK